eukprot:scaffold12033_cov125-Isochrysis_galbana.AAC.6
MPKVTPKMGRPSASGTIAGLATDTARHREQAGVGEIAVMLEHVQDATALPDGAPFLNAELIQRNEAARGRALQELAQGSLRSLERDESGARASRA